MRTLMVRDLVRRLRWPLRSAALLGMATLSCVGTGTGATRCAGGSIDGYQKHAASFQWSVYCPTFLPAGFEVESIQPPDLAPTDRGASLVTFRNGDQTIEVIQGYILTTLPRDDSGLPISTPTREVMFGDVPSQLFLTGQNVPLVRSISTTDRTRAIRGSAGLDPDVVVRVAEGMRVVTKR